MYIQPTSEDMNGIQLPRDYSGTAFGNEEAPMSTVQEETATSKTPPAAHENEGNDAAPAFAPTRKQEACAKKERSGLFSFLSGNPLLSSLLPPPRKGHEGENDIMQWILVGVVLLILLNDSDDDILPLLLLLLLWK